MEITPASASDVDGILTLQTQIYRIETLPQNARETLQSLIDSQDAEVLVAKDDEQILGSATIYFLKNPGHLTPFAYLEGVVVNESARGQGIGKALGQKSVDVAKEKGCYKILATSKEGKDDVHKFYEGLGFSKWGFEFRMDL